MSDLTIKIKEQSKLIRDSKEFHGITANTLGNPVVNLTGALQEIALEKQDNYSSQLKTASKYIVGSINELYDICDGSPVYGIEWNEANSSPDCTRIGNMRLHRSLPVQNLMRGCIVKKDGTIAYYLDKNNWDYKEGRMETSKLDGTDGYVMVEIPEFWYKYEESGTIKRMSISAAPVKGFQKSAHGFYSAYEPTSDRTTNTLVSVKSDDVRYRGGNNQSAWDGTYRSMLGMPATNINLTNFRVYARKNGPRWNCNVYEMYKSICWLFFVEYSTFNVQKDVNNSLTLDGYKQGGLGIGVTNLNSTKWNTFNGYYPVVKCGTSDSLANNSGEVLYNMPIEYDSNILTTRICRYRGIENPFGHLWKITDGLIFDANAVDFKIYKCINNTYGDVINSNYEYIGNLPTTEGYVKSLLGGLNADITPSILGGSNSTYKCDYFYTNWSSSKGLRIGLLGGSANYGSNSGLLSFLSNSSASSASAHFSSRLTLY